MEHNDITGETRLSYEESWELGYDDIELVHQIVKTNDETPEQDELREQHDLVTDRLPEMDAEMLRAYVAGMRGWLWDHLW